MRKFIIYSTDGFTFSPSGKDAEEPDIENCQILDIITVEKEGLIKNIIDKKMIDEFVQQGYKNIFVIEVIGEPIRI
jgi:hypothetical protein